MDAHRTPGSVELRDAATVMLVRDGLDGLETLLLRRNPAVEFVGGAHVFPGGAVDGPDRDLAALAALGPGRDDADASRELGLSRGGLAYWAAAVRECFEEAGILLAHDRRGRLLSTAEPDRARLAGHRRAVDSGRRRFADVCRVEGLRLAFESIHYLGHWITPAGSPRRYDTRFFVASSPAGQEASPDDREAVASTWMTPSGALDRWRAGDLELILPTQRSLEVAARFASADSFLDALAAVPRDAMGARRTVGDHGGRIVALDPVQPGALVP